MASIKYSPLINEIRGSIGNATFQRSIAGNVVRNKPGQASRSSQSAINAKSIFQQIVFAWRDLSTDQKANWQNFLKFSPDFMKRSPKTLLSGYSLFVKYNSLRLMCGFSIIEDIVYTSVTLSATRGFPYIDSGALWFDIGQGIPGVDWLYEIRLSRPCASRSSRLLSDLRIVQAYNGPNQLANINAEYLNAWGIQPVAAQYMGFSLRFFSSVMPFVYQPIAGICNI